MACSRPNGAGKTTLLRMIPGLIHPTKGESFLFGQRMTPSSPLLRRVGSLVESPGFVPHLSGMENLKAYWLAGGQKMAEANLEEALAIAGLGSAIHRKARTYSKGMLQRLAIAQVILNRPELLVLDEPTLGLDPGEVRDVRDLIRRLAVQGATILLSSHILAEVEQVCNHAAVMNHVRQMATGRVDELTQDCRHRTYIALFLMVEIPVLMTLAVEFGRHPRNDRDFFALASHSGLNVPLAALTAASSFLLVVVVSLFAGGSVAEESGWGSLRYLLLRPISRSHVLSSKLAVAALLALAAAVTIMVSGLIAGTIAFGWHPVDTPDGVAFSQGSALSKLALSTVYVAWCMAGVIALAFMISTMTDTSMGAVIGAVGLSIISQILD